MKVNRDRRDRIKVNSDLRDRKKSATCSTERKLTAAGATDKKTATGSTEEKLTDIEKKTTGEERFERAGRIQINPLRFFPTKKLNKNNLTGENNSTINRAYYILRLPRLICRPPRLIF